MLYTNLPGLGGVFLLKRGAAKQHVMRDFSPTPLRDETELNAWLKFHEMPATLIAVGTLITADAVKYQPFSLFYFVLLNFSIKHYLFI